MLFYKNKKDKIFCYVGEKKSECECSVSNYSNCYMYSRFSTFMTKCNCNSDLTPKFYCGQTLNIAFAEKFWTSGKNIQLHSLCKVYFTLKSFNKLSLLLWYKCIYHIFLTLLQLFLQ